MIISVDTFNGKVVEIVFVRFALYLHMCVSFDIFMAFNKATHFNHV